MTLVFTLKKNECETVTSITVPIQDNHLERNLKAFFEVGSSAG